MVLGNLKMEKKENNDKKLTDNNLDNRKLLNLFMYTKLLTKRS